MWRDRTNLYISYRQSYAHHPTSRNKYATGASGASSTPYSDNYAPEDRRGLLSAGAFEDDGDAVIEMDLLPPRWADMSAEITEILTEITTKGHSLEKLHQKHVLPGFNDDDAKRIEERKIEKLTQEITKGFHQCHGCLQRIEQLVRESKQTGTISNAEETMAKNLQISLATRVQDASANFRKKQSAYLKKLRGMGGLGPLSPGERSSTPQPGSYLDPSMQESDADRSFSQSTLQAQKMMHSNDAVIAQREREIEEIAQGIIELSDLFRDLQTMVIDQGTMLDRIDYNVERMHTDVKAAEKEIKVASGYQRRTTKRKIILLLFLVVAGMFILLLVKPKKR
ncbi:t-SNARE affecting a late Golgi compartment protein-like protein [Hapsidospora chrysogenum ATCC 11550]|uniref:t-SNARE affecting a late Golgi compartment protein-like protein n=1 Tax=Hapsidospora chrysogenum (strain ATCC 11550 / CBS 779.69 / DSM 880 / IAM 14645 / JCM 23072 / IMI 49137) TaxID=857340 RepID=A0A086T1N3_HAPC1|nr:t-SNARE affecting a late Golgi compartment protein-like protein [Hapsidospora chrysogenum ATCC 11550]